MGSILTRGNKIYLIFSFLRFSIEVKHGVEFQQSTYNASSNRNTKLRLLHAEYNEQLKNKRNKKESNGKIYL